MSSNNNIENNDSSKNANKDESKVSILVYVMSCGRIISTLISILVFDH